jgi:hypothetical protein
MDDERTAFKINEQKANGAIYQAGRDITIVGAQPRIPLDKPPRPENFVGREEDLISLLNDLQPGRVVTLCGPGGMGKTAIAIEVI